MSERRPMIAGNWKMNLTIDESVDLVKAIASDTGDIEEVDVLVAPPFTAILAVREAIRDSKIFLSGQNMHAEVSGAYTGEISGKMLKDVGCTHVILGHSERRSLFNETSEDIDSKTKAAALVGLIPVLCVGETLEEREAEQTFAVIEKQLDVSLGSFKADHRMAPSAILAYEPVWAIGTGKTATPGQAQEIHKFIREWVRKNFNSETAEQIRILYGGSVKSENISTLMSETDIDGALVGGAGLKADSFVPIIRYQKG